MSEWLHLVLRWTHVLAGITWIGNSFYFMWLDRALEPPKDGDPHVTGSLWMVHSGGFYRIEKRLLGAGQVPPVLHWFKWEAALTWLSGLALLVLVYDLGGLLLDPGTARIGSGAAIVIGLGALPIAWILYDRLWMSPLASRPAVATAVSYGLLVAAAFALSQLLSGRATYLHVGAMLGTIMVVNVWNRILPAQREMIAATHAGRPRDAALARRAKTRSVHNSYMTLPVVVLMLSPHFPSTYGYRHAWVVLAVLTLAGAAFRHWMIVRTRRTAWLAVGAVTALVALALLTNQQ